MPTTTGGLNVTYPNEDAENWYTTWETLSNDISDHDHTGAPNGVALGSTAISNLAITTAKIQDDAVTADKVRFANNTSFNANNSSGTETPLFKYNASDQLEFLVASQLPSTVSGNCTISGAATLSGTSTFNNSVTFSSTSTPTFSGTATINNNVQFTQLLDTNSNELLKFTSTASAVNELTVVNAATGNAPDIQATGGDTNIHLKLTPKGTGGVIVNKISFDNGTSFISSSTSPFSAWVSFQGTGTVTILDSDNVSSITDNGTGSYTLNFTSALANANYAATGTVMQESTSDGNTFAVNSRTTTTCAISTTDDQGVAEDVSYVSAMVKGD